MERQQHVRRRDLAGWLPGTARGESPLNFGSVLRRAWEGTESPEFTGCNFNCRDELKVPEGRQRALRLCARASVSLLLALVLLTALRVALLAALLISSLAALVLLARRAAGVLVALLARFHVLFVRAALSALRALGSLRGRLVGHR